MANEPKSVPLIRIDGVVPKSKAAIAEALEACPNNVQLFQSSTSGGTKITELSQLNAGDTIAFTDGEGKYYGTIKRGYGETPNYLMDWKLSKENQ